MKFTCEKVAIRIRTNIGIRVIYEYRCPFSQFAGGLYHCFRKLDRLAVKLT